MKTLKITTHWTTQQAEDIYMLLEELKSAIWESYGEDITELHRDIAIEQEEREESFNDELLF